MAVYNRRLFDDLESLLGDYQAACPLSFKGIAEGVENRTFTADRTRARSSSRSTRSACAKPTCPSFLACWSICRRAHRLPAACPKRERPQWTKLNGRPARSHLPERLSLRRPDVEHCAERDALWPPCICGTDFGIRRRNALGARQLARVGRGVADGADGVQAGLRKLIEDAVDRIEHDCRTTCRKA